MNSNATTPPKVFHWIHHVLLAGVLTSCLLLMAGLWLALSHHEKRPEGPPPNLANLIQSAKSGQGLGYMDLGLIILMLTPVARVAALVCGWSWTREWKFAGIALSVLILLGSSIFLGVG